MGTLLITRGHAAQTSEEMHSLLTFAAKDQDARPSTQRQQSHREYAQLDRGHKVDWRGRSLTPVSREEGGSGRDFCKEWAKDQLQKSESGNVSCCKLIHWATVRWTGTCRQSSFPPEETTQSYTQCRSVGTILWGRTSNSGEHVPGTPWGLHLLGPLLQNNCGGP